MISLITQHGEAAIKFYDLRRYEQFILTGPNTSASPSANGSAESRNEWHPSFRKSRLHAASWLRWCTATISWKGRGPGTGRGRIAASAPMQEDELAYAHTHFYGCTAARARAVHSGTRAEWDEAQ